MIAVPESTGVLLWTIGVGAVAAAVLVTSWWRWGRDPKRGVSGPKKTLAHTPGVQVLYSKDSSTDNSNGGWGQSSPGRDGGQTQGGDTKWEQSKQKGDLGYYFAHHITMKELAPEDYTMNGPRLLSKGNSAATTASPSSSPPPAQQSRRCRPQQISSYSWEDYGEEVRLTFRQPGWDWAEVEPEEIRVEWNPRRFRMSIESRKYGLHAIDLQRLDGEVANVRVRKLKSRLVVALVKGGRGPSSRKIAWSKLQAAPKVPSG